MLSYNESITWDDILANPDKPWDNRLLCRRSDATWKIYKDNQHLLPENMYYFNMFCNITIDDITANPGFPWDFDALSQNPNITLEIMQANPEFPWSYDVYWHNPNATWENVKDLGNIEKYEYLCCNKNSTLKLMDANDSLFQHYKDASLHKQLTWEFIESHSDKEWDYYYLSMNDMEYWQRMQKLIQKRINTRAKCIKRELFEIGGDINM